MAYIQKDRVKETTTTTGTGAITLAGAVLGFQAFSAVMSVADTCYYVIVSATGADWETGTGTYSAASVLTRTTVLSSSNSGNAVSFASGTKDVFMGPIAERVTDIAHGGTGATTAAGARTNLGVSTGTVTSVSVASANGFGGTVATATTTPAITLTTSITGLLKGSASAIVAAVAGTDYLTPSGSAAGLTNFPTLNQSTTGNAATVTTNANLTGDITSVGNATTLTNAPVIAKVLTGYVSGAGTVAATDSILVAIQKLNANDATNADLTGHVTSVGNATVLGSFTSAQLATALSDETGTGAAVFATSPTLVTPVSNTLSAVPVGSGAGNALTIAAGSGIGTGSGANLILNPGEFATSGTRGTVLIDGLNAGKSKSSGIDNTVFGVRALAAITTGAYNVAIGSDVLKDNTTGVQNTAIGPSALFANIGGNNNTALGIATLLSNQSGGENVAVGLGALLNNVSGSNNIGIGHFALRYVTGAGNIGIGFQAGVGADNLTSGENNLLLGSYTTMGSGNGAATNSIVIGANAIGKGSNTTAIGTTSTTATWLYGVVNSTVYTVATLPAAATAGAGARAFVSDATLTTFATTPIGGGANGVPVYSDGTAWFIG